MVELRCNTCPNLANDFCLKLKVVLPNGLAKLHYGGAIGIYCGNITYLSKCGIEQKVKNEQRLNVIVSNLDKEILEHRQ